MSSLSLSLSLSLARSLALSLSVLHGIDILIFLPKIDNFRKKIAFLSIDVREVDENQCSTMNKPYSSLSLSLSLARSLALSLSVLHGIDRLIFLPEIDNFR